MKISIYIILMIFLVGISLAYTGQVKTNISITLTNDTLKVYNEQLGEQITNYNMSNLTEIKINYSWYLDYEYNLSGQNITILNYTVIQNCTYSPEELEEIKILIREQTKNASYEDAKLYYQLYHSCFSNLTICENYKQTNEGYKVSYDNCNEIKSSYYDQNLKMINDYIFLNNTYNVCALDRDNYSGQRWIWSGVIAIVLIIIYYIKTKWFPEYSKYGKLGTRKDKFPNISSAPKIDEIEEKKPITHIFQKKETIPNMQDIEERRGGYNG